MPYSVITIVAMLTYQSTCGCVCQSVQGSLNTYLFIVSHLKYYYKYTNLWILSWIPSYKITKELLEK